MCPLAVGINGQMVRRIGRWGGMVVLLGETVVDYKGDWSGRVDIWNKEDQRVGSAVLPKVGDKAEIGVNVMVPPVERGGEAAEVTRKVNLERCL